MVRSDEQNFGPVHATGEENHDERNEATHLEHGRGGRRITISVAAMTATEAIKQRQKEMEGVRDGMMALGAIAKKEQPFDAEVVKASAAKIADHLAQAAELFPEGSDEGEVQTWAKPEIWTDRAHFDEILESTRQAAVDLQSVTEARRSHPPSASSETAARAVTTCTACPRIEAVLPREGNRSGPGGRRRDGRRGACSFSPRPVRADERLPAHDPDPARGEVLYHAGGCISCHKTSATAGVTGPPAGGAAFPTPVGTFWPGNLTPDPETGIGSWTAEEFVDAMMRGVSPDRRHYFPAFPYPSYRNMRVEDVLDLRAYLSTLEPVRSPGRAPDVPMLGLARRAVGLWKRLALGEAGFHPDPGADRGVEPRRLPGERPRALRRVPHPAQRPDDPRREPRVRGRTASARRQGRGSRPARSRRPRAVLRCLGSDVGAAVRRDAWLRQALERRNGRCPDEPRHAARRRSARDRGVPAQPRVTSVFGVMGPTDRSSRVPL